MKKLIIILAAVFMAGNVVAANQNKTDKHGKKQGAWVKTYKNGKTQYEGAFKDDVPVGTFKRYYENGNLQSVQVYGANDKSDVTFYEVDGKTISSEGHFEGKKKTGEWKFYSEGKLVLTENYVDNQRHGIAKAYKNGNVMEETPYVKGAINGVRTAYLEGNKIYSTTTYKNGVMDGPYCLFEGRENPTEKGTFVNNKKHGVWESFDQNGKVVESITYTNGVANNNKELHKQNKSQYLENQDVIKSKKYIEPTEMFGGTVVTQ